MVPLLLEHFVKVINGPKATFYWNRLQWIRIFFDWLLIFVFICFSALDIMQKLEGDEKTFWSTKVLPRCWNMKTRSSYKVISYASNWRADKR